MTRIATNVPAESDLLCEHCGYTLNGLPPDGRCPECGTPMADSIGPGRTPPVWETAESHKLAAWIATTRAVIFHPTHFYRTLTTRGNVQTARTFAQVHWGFASILFGLTAGIHLNAMDELPIIYHDASRAWLADLALVMIIFFALSGVTRLAARLTNWEATYRGLRLTTPVVLRGMYYHAAHYLPVALLGFLTVLTYRWLRLHGEIDGRYDITYLYVIAAEVIVGAIYLFQTYWIAMRNMMYANR
jgi:hypothetical protein